MEATPGFGSCWCSCPWPDLGLGVVSQPQITPSRLGGIYLPTRLPAFTNEAVEGKNSHPAYTTLYSCCWGSLMRRPLGRLPGASRRADTQWPSRSRADLGMLDVGEPQKVGM